LGVRAEHPQSLIDSIQYSCDYRGELLPPPYSIVKQVGGRGILLYVPRRIIAPCATSPEKWLLMVGHRLKRSLLTLVVVELKLEDFKPFAKHGALAGLEFQSIEQKRAASR
jgi:hypothetical protein